MGICTKVSTATPWRIPGLNFAASTASFAGASKSGWDDLTTRTVHIVFPATATSIGTSKVLYIRAANGANSFSYPVNLVDAQATGNQFMPAIAADLSVSGRITVTWFDTRNNVIYPNRQIDIYGASSTNNGISFAIPNLRVTPIKTDVGTTSFVGDYTGLAACGGRALPAYALFVTPLRTATIT